MSPDFIERAVATLAATYDVRTSNEGPRRYVRLDAFEMPPGCSPASTRALVVLDPSQPKPLLYVAPGQLLANGTPPRSTSAVLVGGESWLQFSFNLPWEERHGILHFVTGARARFAQHA